MFGASSELASVMEFGFYELKACERDISVSRTLHKYDIAYLYRAK